MLKYTAKLFLNYSNYIFYIVSHSGDRMENCMKKTRIIALLLLVAIMLSSCDVSIKLPGISSLVGSNNSSNTGGNTSGGNTSGGNTSGGNTSGGNTSGGNTSGGNTSGGNASDGNTSGGNNSNYINDDITFDIGEKVFIVTAAGENTPTLGVDVSITSAIGMPGAYFATDDEPKAANELTIGRCDREVSTLGYEKLGELERESILVARYGIYSTGNSVALVYDFVPGFEKETILETIRLFENNFIEYDTPINIEAGSFYSGTIDFTEKQTQKDDEIVSSAWNAFSNKAGNAATAALRQMYNDLYSDKLLTWFASLYDADLGGFYFSASARDNYQVEYEGSYYELLPDIESTAQAIGFIEDSGMMTGFNSLRDVLPLEMQEQIIKFIKQKQVPGGYFYHPQWPEEKASISRRSRDLTNAVTLLKKLGAKPTYTTTTNIEGDGILWDGTPVSAKGLTLPLDVSCEEAVAVVVAATTSVPSHLVDKDSFQTYLDGLSSKIKSNSYEVGHELSTQTTEIKARDAYLKSQGADYSLVDMLISFLDSKCSATSGHWGTAGTYSGLNGLMKISSVYEALSAPLPYPEAAARSAIDTITKADVSGSTVCYAYNSWVAICNIISNVKNHRTSDASTIINNIRGELRSNAAALITATAEKQGSFICDDGSFSYYKTKNTETSQGMPVALPGIKEGDINATTICSTKTLEYMFKAFDYPVVPIFSLSDLVTFISLTSENKLTFNYASSDSNVEEGAVNFSFYDYKVDENTTAKMIKLYNPENYTTEKLQRKVITGIINSEKGVEAGLSIDDLDFYLSIIFNGKFVYKYASTLEDTKDGYINYSTKSPSGKAPVLRIYNSHKISSEADMREILTYLITSEAFVKKQFYLSDIDYYVMEWKAHNIMYEDPSVVSIMSEDEVKARAEHVDLNVDDSYAFLYEIIVKNN